MRNLLTIVILVLAVAILSQMAMRGALMADAARKNPIVRVHTFQLNKYHVICTQRVTTIKCQ